MVVVFVPKESQPRETRVAAIPETVKGMIKSGLEVQVEKDAGAAAGFTDAQFEEAGATIVDAAARNSAKIVLGILPPSADHASEIAAEGILICSLQPLLNLQLVEKLAERKVTTFALDLMPRITRAQKMDILSSQATVAGYQAVLMAATELPKMFPLMMTAAGTLAPAKVLVLGAGVAGLQAIATAKRLGAVVEANDIRPAVREQVESLGAKFVDTGTPPEAETKGGYAKETSEDYARKQREILTRHIAGADVVVTTALIPGKKAPILVTAEMVKAMHPGSVIVDLAAAMGGNVEGTKPDEKVTVEGVTILGETNLPALCANDASRMFARNVLALFPEFTKEGAIGLDLENEILDAVVVTHGGEVRHKGAAEALASKGAS